MEVEAGPTRKPFLREERTRAARPEKAKSLNTKRAMTWISKSASKVPAMRVVGINFSGLDFFEFYYRINVFEER